MMKKRISLIFVIIWMLFIFILSSYSAPESSNQSGIIVDTITTVFKVSESSTTFHMNTTDFITFIVRKLAHFSEYLVLGILVCNMINNYRKKIYIGSIICILYAISDEIHQIFIPGRSCEIRDMVIDIIGALIGIYIVKKIKK